jgi:uncharacterized protein YdhG (YjbR/CyaY superfamily)
VIQRGLENETLEEIRMSDGNDELKITGGFTMAEREAMKQRAEELRAERGGAKKAEGLQSLLDAIAEMPDGDREIAERIHAIVIRLAPHLLPKAWYGMPAWADGKDVVCFFQTTVKFGARYGTLGFNDRAKLDDGDMWPTYFAVTRWTDSVAKEVERLVKTATG